MTDLFNYGVPLLAAGLAMAAHWLRKPKLKPAVIPPNMAMSEAILRKLVETVNSGKNITFEANWGDNTLTIYIEEQEEGGKSTYHTHVGIPSDLDKDNDAETWPVLLKNLLDTLSGGPGLSWHKE